MRLSYAYTLLLDNKSWRYWDNIWVNILIKFRDTPIEENAYAICRRSPYAIEMIGDPTENVIRYNKLYWA
jgi:hypothetical protein